MFHRGLESLPLRANYPNSSSFITLNYLKPVKHSPSYFVSHSSIIYLLSTNLC